MIFFEPLPFHWYGTNVRIIFDTTKLFCKINKNNLLGYMRYYSYICRMQDNTQIQVRSKFWATSPIRIVTYINGGIQVDKHWFSWNCFFEVNEIV